ncbi:hypothetical protein [Cryobacterium sp. GrIS_2_6]|uniref:hypothetical protein n=1 Tax=Cryobacterium sp. GrIS_2_6 TaxID=3162785 RepID=UPI002E06E842|nr:hypothetical protein [Cryobacterium psychrotolerans]
MYNLQLKFIALCVPVVCLVTLGAINATVVIPIAVGLSVALLVSLRWSGLVAPLLIVCALPLMRPSILGESTSLLAAVLVGAAALITVVEDHGRVKLFGRDSAPLRRVSLWAGLAYLWLLVRAALFDPQSAVVTIAQGGALLVGTVLFASIVLADPRRARTAGRLFVSLIAALSLSYVVTFAVWSVGGMGSGQVAQITVGSWPGLQPVYFPFTPTLSQSNINGIVIPRFVGIGREPGWMALYSAVAFFLAPAVGCKSKWLRLVILVSIIAPLSTAGFGSFAVAAVVAWIVSRRAKTALGGYIRLAFSAALLGFSLWLAIVAPVLGLSAKASLNIVSLDERTAATLDGLHALLTSPFSGGIQSSNIGAVNLIAAIASFGVPFSFAIALAILSPLIGRWQLLAPIATVIFITLIASQPALDSTAVFMLVALAVAQFRTPDSAEVPEAAVTAFTASVPLLTPTENRASIAD